MPEVVIMGAGPAGLTLGCYLAQAGVPCLIVEKALHPRPHVGESLMPATIRVFNEIGFLPVLEAAGFPHSRGVVYHQPCGATMPIAYGEFPQEGIDQDYTYHVDRSRFDLLLLKHAESLGCRIVQGVAVAEVLFDEMNRACGVLATIGDRELELPARVVVDAAGRVTKLGRQLDLRRDHPVLDQFALHAWFVGVDRGSKKTEVYTHVFLVPELKGWVWQAPIDGEITSLGLVADRRAYHESGLDVQDFFTYAMKSNKGLAKAVRKAARVNDLKGEVNYSYRLDQVCGSGWLAVGDAARFVDPVFSSGVSLAVHSARFAAERIAVAIEARDFGRETFLPYERELFAGAAIWEEFIGIFYQLPEAFAHFVESTDHRMAILRLLQGEIHDRSEAAVLDEMAGFLRKALGEA